MHKKSGQDVSQARATLARGVGKDAISLAQTERKPCNCWYRSKETTGVVALPTPHLAAQLISKQIGIARRRYEVTLAGLLHAVTKTQTLGQHLPDDKTRAGLKAGALPGKAGAASHPAYGSDTVKDVDRRAIAAPPGKRRLRLSMHIGRITPI